MLRRRAVVFLISDFRVGENEEQLQHKLGVTSKHHDVIAVAVNDPLEAELPDVGVLRIEDAETGELVELDTGNAKARESYRKEAAGRKDRIAGAVRRSGVDLLEFSAGGDWVPALMGFFRTRRARK